MTTRKIGASTLTSVNRMPAFLMKLQAAKARATQAMATAARQEAEMVYASDGDGTWAPNAPGTIEWKGFDGPMRGRTATLSQDIRIIDSPATPRAKAVGWFEDPHPDTDGRLSMGALATVHEFGPTDENSANFPARPWLSKVHDDPNHAAAVYAAGKKGYVI